MDTPTTTPTKNVNVTPITGKGAQISKPSTPKTKPITPCRKKEKAGKHGDIRETLTNDRSKIDDFIHECGVKKINNVLKNNLAATYNLSMSESMPIKIERDLLTTYISVEEKDVKDKFTVQMSGVNVFTGTLEGVKKHCGNSYDNILSMMEKPSVPNHDYEVTDFNDIKFCMKQMPFENTPAHAFVKYFHGMYFMKEKGENYILVYQYLHMINNEKSKNQCIYTCYNTEHVNSFDHCIITCRRTEKDDTYHKINRFFTKGAINYKNACMVGTQISVKEHRESNTGTSHVPENATRFKGAMVFETKIGKHGKDKICTIISDMKFCPRESKKGKAKGNRPDGGKQKDEQVVPPGPLQKSTFKGFNQPFSWS